MSFQHPRAASQSNRDILSNCIPLKQTHSHMGNSILCLFSNIHQQMPVSMNNTLYQPCIVKDEKVNLLLVKYITVQPNV